MRRYLTLATGLLILNPAAALAVCTNDLDCDGANICVSGVCTLPSGAGPVSTPTPTAASETASTPDGAAVPPPVTPSEDVAPTAGTVPSPETSPAPTETPDATTAEASATGQCLKDTDCKGTRICQQGMCVEPGTTITTTTTAAPPQTPAVDRPLSNGWALGGGVAGMAMLIPITSLGIASAVTSDDQIPAIPLGASATILIATMGPLTFAAGKSARRGGRVRGAIGLRVTGWIFYGISLANAIALIGLGVADVDVAPWQIALTTALGDLSLIFFSIDAFIAYGQVRAKRAARPVTRQDNRSGILLSPTVTPIVGADGLTGAIAGIGATF